MNIRSEISLEIIRDNMSFSFSIPSNTTHDIAHEVCLQIADGILEMKKQAEEIKKANEAASVDSTN